MTQEDRNRADARFNKAARAAHDAQSGKTERDAALKAVTDNMAKLRALRKDAGKKTVGADGGPVGGTKTHAKSPAKKPAAPAPAPKK